MPKGVAFDTSIRNLDDAPSPSEVGMGINGSASGGEGQSRHLSRNSSTDSNSRGFPRRHHHLETAITPPASPLGCHHALRSPPPSQYEEDHEMRQQDSRSGEEYNDIYLQQDAKEEEKEAYYDNKQFLAAPSIDDRNRSLLKQPSEYSASGGENMNLVNTQHPGSSEERFGESEMSANPLDSQRSDSPEKGRKSFWTNWQVASCITRNAPCFWFCWDRLETAATDRSILSRLSYLCSFFGLIQISSATFLAIALHDKRIADRSEVRETSESNVNAPSLWDLQLSLYLLGIIGFAIFVMTLLNRRNVRQVNMVGSVRYLWYLLWILPIQTYLAIALFDYHRVTNVWIKVYWNTPSLAWFRSLYCAPGTSQGQCTVPVGGFPLYGSVDEGNNQGELLWCMSLYNQTDCSSIRNEAQSDMQKTAYLFYTYNGVLGLVLVVLLFLSVQLLEGIITKPIVQRSRQSNVPGWLTLPIIGCFVIGSVLLRSPSSLLRKENANQAYWIGLGFAICGGLFCLIACLGWFLYAFSILNTRDRKYKNAAAFLFIVISGVTTLSLGAMFSTNVYYSFNYLSTFPNNDSLGARACSIDSSESCSFCDNDVGLPECPEWTVDDIAKITRTTLKQSATLSAIFLLYSISTLRFGFILRNHLLKYQIDYV